MEVVGKGVRTSSWMEVVGKGVRPEPGKNL
jgi:hypothetical protein